MQGFSQFSAKDWHVFSCFDEEGWKNVKPVEGDINIATFHGGVLGSKTDTEWDISGEVAASFFDDYDFTFLGDISLSPRIINLSITFLSSLTFPDQSYFFIKSIAFAENFFTSEP